MVAITIDGDLLDVQCPFCNGTDEHKSQLDEGARFKCFLCDGTGLIEDVPCYGEIEVDLEPTRMEGL